MDWKVPFLLIFCLVSTATHAGKTSKRAVLHLRGVVPLKLGVNLVQGENSALVPTLKSNSPTPLGNSIKVKTSRSPASFGEVQKVVIESH